MKNRALGHDINYYDVDKMFKMLIHSPALLNQYQITDFRHSCLYRGGEPNQNNCKAMALDTHNPFFIYAMIPLY